MPCLSEPLVGFAVVEELFAGLEEVREYVVSEEEQRHKRLAVDAIRDRLRAPPPPPPPERRPAAARRRSRDFAERDFGQFAR